MTRLISVALVLLALGTGEKEKKSCQEGFGFASDRRTRACLPHAE
jgi:hypothetical protein